MKAMICAALFAATVFGASSFAADPPPAAPVDPVAACAAEGGVIEHVPPSGIEVCVVTYKDGGKACTDGDECEGDCLTTEQTPVPGADGLVHGMCTEKGGLSGCFAQITKGVPGPFVCME
ncbi:hypothetical protein sos41_08110 [Alphaproteobacteria bacterium SO-S41]|nr:hypothetical protein sos41_08110 [Alphaproteobacteria bacterium SO-S41]